MAINGEAETQGAGASSAAGGSAASSSGERAGGEAAAGSATAEGEQNSEGAPEGQRKRGKAIKKKSGQRDQNKHKYRKK